MKINYQMELTRRDVSPAQFLAYIRSQAKKHDIPFGMELDYFVKGDGSDSHYIGGTPETRPCESETCKALPCDHQTYMRAFDGSVFNEIIEFTYDTETTGHGYYYTISADGEPDDAERIRTSTINYHARKIKQNARKIEKNTAEISETQNDIDRGYRDEKAAGYHIENLKHENDRMTRENDEHRAAIDELTETDPTDPTDRPDTETDTDTRTTTEKKGDNTMNTNENKKNLLTVNLHALQGLHSLIGYDFEKPHAIAHIHGRFTVNNALQAIGGADRDNTVALLVRDSAGVCYDKLHVVTIDSIGRIETNHKGGYGFGLDYFSHKCSFEELRKKSTVDCFIVSQRSEYVKKPQERPFDPSARFEYVPGKDIKCGDGHDNSWIGRITVRSLDGSNAIYEINKDGLRYKFSTVIYRCPDEYRPQIYLDIIDKSGYLLPERRTDLLRRADLLRKERAKAAYQATDNTAKVEELRAMVEAKKAEFAAAIASATTSEELRETAHNLYFTFMWTMSEFERFADKTNRHDYVSIEAAENAYNSIKSKLEKKAC